MKIFASGSCRLVASVNDGHGKVRPIHSMFHNFTGINFLGKLHNTKQHIQFLRFLKDEITLPDDILRKFLTSYGGFHGRFTDCEDRSLLPLKKEAIKHQFDDCEWYLFEICSMKRYQYNGFEVQHEVTKEYSCSVQTEAELMEDLHTIRALVPAQKKILFQVHFRPDVIYGDPRQAIVQRDTIYRTVHAFCQQTEHTFLHDPSVLLRANRALFDGDTHFSPRGLRENFAYLYSHYLNH